MDGFQNSGVAVTESVRLDDDNNALIILDQTLLPNEKKYLEVKKIEDVWEAIHSLRVRGAPAIGIAAAFGIYLWAKSSQSETYENLFEDFIKGKDFLATSRPTAVNLFWALDRMEDRLKAEEHNKKAEMIAALKDEAEKIRLEDEQVCEAIGKNALSLLEPGWGILTHCNAGTIATSGLGTALAPIYLGQAESYDFKVFADETRPLLQGARLTAWELKEAGVDVTLICDNMASIVMKEGKIQAVLVGCDRVVANGDVANKIGTSGVAILANYYSIPFYVCAPLSTIDLKCETGDSIEIEIRNGEEITSKWYEKPMAPEGVNTYNPCFDVTDHKIITAIITEKGVAYPPYENSLKKFFE